MTEWVRGVWNETGRVRHRRHLRQRSGPERSVRDAYADEIWERLVGVKRRYDPDGVFSGNGIG